MKPRIPSVLALALLLAAGCDGSPQDSDTEPLTFSESSVLGDSFGETCTAAYYWPAAMSHFAVGVFPVAAPEAPYRITGFSGELLDAAGAFVGGERSCDPTVGVRVFAFLHDGSPEDFELDASGLPVTGVLAEAVLTGERAEEDWTNVHAEVVLEEPVVVHGTERLWIGYDAGRDPGSEEGACFSGCDEGDDELWFWLSEDGWFSGQGWEQREDQNALLTVSVDHN